MMLPSHVISDRPALRFQQQHALQKCRCRGRPGAQARRRAKGRERDASKVGHGLRNKQWHWPLGHTGEASFAAARTARRLFYRRASCAHILPVVSERIQEPAQEVCCDGEA